MNGIRHSDITLSLDGAALSGKVRGGFTPRTRPGRISPASFVRDASLDIEGELTQLDLDLIDEALERPRRAITLTFSVSNAKELAARACRRVATLLSRKAREAEARSSQEESRREGQHRRDERKVIAAARRIGRQRAYLLAREGQIPKRHAGQVAGAITLRLLNGGKPTPAQLIARTRWAQR